jgi:hypothetical protein
VRADETQIDAPETPAPVFAVRAFKHAIFGTPQPPPTVAPARFSKSKSEPETLPPIPTLTGTKENVNITKIIDSTDLGLSPTKRGILKTPGGGTTRRKELVWGADVVDNECKKQSRSGLPNNAPGKFPSPWTPKNVDVNDDKKSKVEEKKPKTKLKERLHDAKVAGISPRSVKGRAKDDADITIDMMEPRSESGRYWKEQYLSYSQKSEDETRKLIAKQKLARDYARKKDEEATDLRRQLENDRKKRHGRESSLEMQVKDLREQLRQALAENARTCTEIAMLRRQAEALSTSKSTKTVPALEEPPIVQIKVASPLRTCKTEKTQSPELELSDFIWNDVAETTTQDDNPRLIDAPYVSTSTKPARSHGETTADRPRRIQRKPATISRQDSVVVAEDVTHKSESRKSGALARTLTPRPGSITPTPRRRTLGERDMNSYLSVPTPALPSPTDLENVAPSSVRKHRRNRDRDEKPQRELFEFDASAPLEALSLQAEQPITPQPPIKETTPQAAVDRTPVPSSRKHRRTEAKVDLPEDRLAAAKARLAARKLKENMKAS